MRKIYTRRNGTRFELTLTVDHEKVADDMAQSLNQRGKTTGKKCNGGIVATIKEL